jgi:hypothetical protein
MEVGVVVNVLLMTSVILQVELVTLLDIAAVIGSLFDISVKFVWYMSNILQVDITSKSVVNLVELTLCTARLIFRCDCGVANWL